MLSDKRFCDVRVNLVFPGENTRIIHALDVVEPRYKAIGPGSVFPGVIGPSDTAGGGCTHRLGNMTVVTAGAMLPSEEVGEFTYTQEAVIDMSGPGSRLSPFSSTINLVLKLEPSSGIKNAPASREGKNCPLGQSAYQDYQIRVRRVGFKVASHLAGVTMGHAPNEENIFELSHASPELPRVAYVAQVTIEYLYGEPVGWQPTFIHPNELIDGAVFAWGNWSGCMRHATYFYQSHPIVSKLYGLHGKSIDFAGILMLPTVNPSSESKERTVGYAAKLLKWWGIEGVVITWEGSGHAMMDVMMLCRQCEASGIKSVLLSPEMARYGQEPGLVYSVPEADAVVSTGNYEAEVSVPEVKLVLGGARLLGTGEDAAGPLKIPIRYFYGATSPLGVGKLRGAPY